MRAKVGENAVSTDPAVRVFAWRHKRYPTDWIAGNLRQFDVPAFCTGEEEAFDLSLPPMPKVDGTGSSGDFGNCPLL